MTSEWDWAERKKSVPAEPVYTGPDFILAGTGCRLMVKSIADEARREEEVLARMHRLVQLLAEAFPENFVTDPRDGYGRIYGGDPPYYVRGTTERDILTTIGKAILSLDADRRAKVSALGVTALVEW